MHFELKKQAGWHCTDTFLHGNEQLLFCVQWGNYKKGRMIQNLQNISSSSLNNPRNDASSQEVSGYSGGEIGRVPQTSACEHQRAQTCNLHRSESSGNQTACNPF